MVSEMKTDEKTSCCDSTCSCHGTIDDGEKIIKSLDIDFMFLDLNICERCITTGETLDEALKSLAPVLQSMNYTVTVNKINIITEELAIKHRFESSPTIRVNGIDICDEVKENFCKDCYDLCGDSVDCRVFVFDGKEYEQPPAAMIADGILRVIYEQKKAKPQDKPYVLPDNLKKYFTGKKSMIKKMQIYEPAMCCPTGLCGVSIDPELLRLSGVLETLKKNGITVDRFNLTSAPLEFVKNTKVNDRLTDEGAEVLPIIIVDEKIVITKRYPTNIEFVKLLGLKAGIIAENEKSPDDDSCCCGESESGEDSSGCYSPVRKGCC